MTTLLEDKDQIRDLFSRYCVYVDSGQAEAYVGLFTEDAIVDLGRIGRFEGRPALLELQKRKGGKTGPMRHFITNSLITVEGDTAHATSYVLVVNTAGEAPVAVMAGHYFDQLVRQEGRWLIRQRLVHPEPVLLESS